MCTAQTPIPVAEVVPFRSWSDPLRRSGQMSWLYSCWCLLFGILSIYTGKMFFMNLKPGVLQYEAELFSHAMLFIT